VTQHDLIERLRRRAKPIDRRFGDRVERRDGVEWVGREEAWVLPENLKRFFDMCIAMRVLATLEKVFKGRDLGVRHGRLRREVVGLFSPH
jgi:hypothetical protein